MKNVRKPVCVLLLTLAMLLALALAHMPEAYSSELTVKEKALSVITDVVGLDTEKYNVTLSNYFSSYPDDYGGLLQEDIVYTLESADNQVRVIATFVNKTLWFVDLKSDTNSLLSAHYSKQLSTDLLDGTRELLQRLQLFTDDASSIQEMRSTMNDVSEINSLNTTVGNLKREALVNTEFVYRNATANYTSTSISIYFMYTVNGVGSPKSVNIHFRDGALTGFSNGWNLFSIGSENVNISKEEAISIAQKQAEKSTTNVISLGNRSVRAELHMFPKKPFTLYPFWFVELPLDYPNSTITGWQTGIWADTGEIAYSHPTGVLGYPLIPTPELLPTEAQPDTQPDDTENGQSATYITIGIASVLVAIVTIAIVLKKRAK